MATSHKVSRRTTTSLAKTSFLQEFGQYRIRPYRVWKRACITYRNPKGPVTSAKSAVACDVCKPCSREGALYRP
jgi:hypothetical protein